MKKVLSAILALLMLALCIPFSGAAAEETLPQALDLTGTIHLPPIANQGGIGACVSFASTYMQLTNAYSRYLHELDPTISWDPSSGQAKYCFAPRFTFNLGGASTAAVYRILQEQGSPTQDYVAFSGGVTGYASYNQLARDWATLDGYWDVAQNFRIENFDQVWVNSACGFDFKTTKGQALITRIKENLNAGNVVVTGGYPDRWVTDLVTISNKGTYGKTGDKAIPYSTNVSSGGHQVAIIGYDDNITCVKNGVTLKGAFKVANSWGQWQNKGCVWMMYDALNGTDLSAYDALNVSNRIWTMDQFVFLDYRTDLKYGTPVLMAKVTVKTADRDSFSFTLTRTDPLTGQTESYMPVMFSERSRADYNQGYGFYGDKNGAAKEGVLTVNYDHLTENLPEGKTVDDYVWGVKVTYFASASGKSSTVTGVELLKNGVSVFKRSGLSDTITEDNAKTYFLSEQRLLLADLPTGVNLSPVGSLAVPAGQDVSFTLKVASGYKADKVLKVTVNGERILPVNGVYTYRANDGDLTGNVLRVEGVVPGTVKAIDAINYGNGFERLDGRNYWMLFSVLKSSMEAAATDMTAISNRTYLYTIRCTIDGVAYDFKPEDYYNFGSSLLFRINVADQGWFPALNATYDMKVEFCRNGVPVYADESFVVTCQLEPSSDAMSAHTHDFTGETVTVTTATCKETGAGYRICSCEGCTAMQAATLPVDPMGHTFRTAPTVTKNATAMTPGEFSCVCAVCSERVFAGYFYAPKGDMSGDNVISVIDATALLAFLARESDAQALACDGDLNGDGIVSIKDLTTLLLVIEGRISF